MTNLLSGIGQSLSKVVDNFVAGGQALKHFFIQLGQMLNGAGLWIYHLPGNAWRALVTFLMSVLKLLLIVVGVSTGMLVLGTSLLYLYRLALRNHLSQLRELRERREEEARAEQYRLYEEGRQQEARAQNERERVRAQQEERQAKAKASHATQERDRAERRKQQEAEQQRRRKQAAADARKREDTRLYQGWRAKYDAIFAEDPHSHLAIPHPPLGPCSACPTQVRTCRHNLERLFSSTGNLAEVLKQERTRWHPDRFGKLKEAGVVGAEDMVTELSQIINGMYDELNQGSRCEG